MVLKSSNDQDYYHERNDKKTRAASMYQVPRIGQARVGNPPPLISPIII